jgi:hypothetical protein
MNQFWTPLAKVFGLSETAPETATVASSTAVSNWPDLFEHFQQLANTQWIRAWQRHKEVSPQDVMSVRRLAIQAGNADIQTQIDTWRAEGTTTQLIEWLVNGPWNTPEIRHFVYFDQLTELLFLPLAPASPQSQTTKSAYEDPQAAIDPAPPAPLSIITDHVWMARPMPQPAPTPEPIQHEAWVEIEDARGTRQFALKGNLFIFGQPKIMAWPDGRSLQLTEGETIAWQGESAVYVATEGLHVSGLHLALRLYESGFDFQDLGSSNGTFDGTQAIRPIVWHSALQAQTLHLGGPDQDAPHDTPRLRITAGLEMTAQAAQPTPLRSSTVTPPPPVFAAPLMLHLEGSNGWRHAQQVTKLPHQLGRDAQCECVIPSEFSKVSRRHLVIEAWDATKQSVLIRDTSTHGVLIQSGSLSGDTRQGAWLTIGSQILIGASQHSPSLLITLALNASDT